jgi:hypothetical protein
MTVNEFIVTAFSLTSVNVVQSLTRTQKVEKRVPRNVPRKSFREWRLPINKEMTQPNQTIKASTRVRLSSAQCRVASLHVADHVHFTTVINAWVQSGDPGSAARAEAILRKMEESYKAREGICPNVVSYSIVMNGYVINRRSWRKKNVNSHFTDMCVCLPLFAVGASRDRQRHWREPQMSLHECVKCTGRETRVLSQTLSALSR